MSFLYDSLLPGATTFHPRHAPQKTGRRAQSHAGPLSSLIHLVRDPTGALDSFVGGQNHDTIPAFAEEDDEQDESRRQILLLHMRDAANYAEWRIAASELDELQGNNAWKLDKESHEYDVELVEARLKQLDDARISCDVERMLFLIRTSLTRGLGGMGDLRLYTHSHIGTKALIERYIESAKETLTALLDVSAKQGDKSLDPRYVLEQLLATRQSFGRSALLLSGGGTFGMNHIGVIKTLWQERLLPRIVSGASAGSIVCAVLCTRTDEEMPKVLDEFCYGELDVFEKEGEGGILQKAARFLKYGAVFDISHLINVMRNMLGDLTFQEAYNRTRRILNITVSSASVYELPRLLNYITAPNVMIWSAVAASCSVPLVFSAASLQAKDPTTGKQVPWDPSPQRWIDGSVDNDLPITRLSEMFNVNHFIVSQVNPHVVPFLLKEEGAMAAEAQQSAAFAAGPSWLHTMADLAKGEALHRLHVLAELGIFPNYCTKARSVLSQRYSGDITIFPAISFAQFPRILSNPTPEFMTQAMITGERATWPKMSRIQNHCAIELALDDAVGQLRARVVFSPSQIDLRQNIIKRPSSVHSESGRGRRKKLGHSRSRRSMDADRGLPGRPISLRLEVPASRPLNKIAHVKTGSVESSFLQIPASEILSSSAEDENDPLISDSEDDGGSLSSMDSPPSPQPALWPTTRQLFPSASQPTTPGLGSRSFRSPSATHLSLTMSKSPEPSPRKQPPSRQSSPERRYKRLFHPHTNPQKHTQTTTPPPEPQIVEPELAEKSSMEVPPRSRRGSLSGVSPGIQNLSIDISGTRGMMLRRRKSASNGLRALIPQGLRKKKATPVASPPG